MKEDDMLRQSVPPAARGRCPHLKKQVIATCRAEDKAYVPSIFQLHEYCRSRDHRKCPFYLNNFAKSYALEGAACR
jgi:hypothetical protein